jgi:hypothetical protein
MPGFNMIAIGRTLIPALLFATSATSAQTVDLVAHNGFEACWSGAITQASFLSQMQSSIEGQTRCVPPGSGTASGVTFNYCNQAQCPGNVVGCPVTVHAGTFSGDFATGVFAGPGTADDIAVPLTYSGAFSGSCIVNVSNITLTYAPNFFVTPDGNNGDYMAYLMDTSSVSIVSDDMSSTDLLCNQAANANKASLNAQAATAMTEALAGMPIGASVCPATP